MVVGLRLKKGGLRCCCKHNQQYSYNAHLQANQRRTAIRQRSTFTKDMSITSPNIQNFLYRPSISLQHKLPIFAKQFSVATPEMIKVSKRISAQGRARILNNKIFLIFLASKAHGQRPASPDPRARATKPQIEETRACTQLLLHGCQVRRLQRDCRCLQPCPDHSRLQQLQKHPQQAHRRQVQTHRRQCLQGQSLIYVPMILRDFNSIHHPHTTETACMDILHADIHLFEHGHSKGSLRIMLFWRREEEHESSLRSSRRFNQRDMQRISYAVLMLDNLKWSKRAIQAIRRKTLTPSIQNILINAKTSLCILSHFRRKADFYAVIFSNSQRPLPSLYHTWHPAKFFLKQFDSIPSFIILPTRTHSFISPLIISILFLHSLKNRFCQGFTLQIEAFGNGIVRARPASVLVMDLWQTNQQNQLIGVFGILFQYNAGYTSSRGMLRWL